MSTRRKEAIMRDIGMKMLEEGQILSKGQYDRCQPVPVRSALVIKQFGSWARMVNIMQASMPALFEEIRLIPKEIEDINPLEALANRTISKTA